MSNTKISRTQGDSRIIDINVQASMASMYSCEEVPVVFCASTNCGITMMIKVSGQQTRDG
jgi:hypothetical protein